MVRVQFRAEDEVFRFLTTRWNVSEGQRLAEAAGIVGNHRLNVNAWANLLGLIGIDAEHAKQVDLSKPVLVGHTPGGESPILIDGWHRLYRAKQEGLEWLPATLLTVEQNEQIMDTPAGVRRRRR